MVVISAPESPTPRSKGNASRQETSTIFRREQYAGIDPAERGNTVARDKAIDVISDHPRHHEKQQREPPETTETGNSSQGGVGFEVDCPYPTEPPTKCDSCSQGAEGGAPPVRLVVGNTQHPPLIVVKQPSHAVIAQSTLAIKE